MPLTPMRYKDYVWPHNPRTYSISYRRIVANDKIPFAHYYMQDLGLDCRVLSGEGEFSGEGAYDEFKRLASIFYSSGPGLLIHPVWQPSSAYFVALELMQEPRRDYVSYRFEFWEDTARHTAGVYEFPSDSDAPDASPAPTPPSSTPSAPTPTVSGTASQKKTHTVRAGETFTSIAAAYNTTAAALIAKNPSLRPAQGLASGAMLLLE